MVAKIPVSVRRLSWFNWLSAVLAVVPCCFVVYSPFLSNVIIDLNLRRLMASLPDGEGLTVPDIVLIPWAVLNSAHVVLLGVPMAAAAIILRRNARLGWQISLGVITTQSVMLAANLMAAFIWRKRAWLALGLEFTTVVFVVETMLLLANVILLWQAAEVLRDDRR